MRGGKGEAELFAAEGFARVQEEACAEFCVRLDGLCMGARALPDGKDVKGVERGGGGKAHGVCALSVVYAKNHGGEPGGQGGGSCGSGADARVAGMWAPSPQTLWAPAKAPPSSRGARRRVFRRPFGHRHRRILWFRTVPNSRARYTICCFSVHHIMYTLVHFPKVCGYGVYKSLYVL